MKKWLIFAYIFVFSSFAHSSLNSDLRMACAHGNMGSLIATLKRGADINSRNKEGSTCLIIAVHQNRYEVIDHLLNSLRKKLDLELQDFYGDTAMLIAMRKGHFTIAHALLAAGAAFDLYDRKDMSPLHYAAKRGHLRTIKILLKKGDDPNKCRGKEQMSPMHYAVLGKSVAAIKLLAFKGAFVNILSYAEWTPMHIAAKIDFTGGILALFYANADLNSVDFGLWTPLHVACHYNSIKSASLLLYLGAYTELRTKNNESISDIAFAKDHWEILREIFSMQGRLF